MQDSIKEFNFERGVKAIASIEATSWFPINAVSNSRIRESISSDVSNFDIFNIFKIIMFLIDFFLLNKSFGCIL